MKTLHGNSLRGMADKSRTYFIGSVAEFGSTGREGKIRDAILEFVCEFLYWLTALTEDVFVFFDRVLERSSGVESELKLLIDALAQVAAGEVIFSSQVSSCV